MLAGDVVVDLIFRMQKRKKTILKKKNKAKIRLLTWKPVNLTPVSKEVVSRAAFCIRATFSGEAASSYNTVPSLMSRMLGLRKGNERFSRTMDCKFL